MDIDCNQFKYIIKNSDHPQADAGCGYRETCVFLLLHDVDAPYIVFILKADNAGYPWRNQMALPGGHIDEMDKTPLDAAFRELDEELNIKRDQVVTIGSMGHFPTINKRDIEVFVGYLKEEGDIAFDPSEIAKVVRIPLAELFRIHVSNHYEEGFPGWEKLLYPYEDIVVWGATARIIHYFIDLIQPAVTLA